MEAMRDRARWRKQGADRLREAGFSDADVKKWEDSGGGGTAVGAEREESDVTWSRRGEKREWDRGKVFGGSDGLDVELKPEWGRLKGA